MRMACILKSSFLFGLGGGYGIWDWGGGDFIVRGEVGFG